MLAGSRVAFVQRSDATDFCDEMADKTGNRPLFLPCDVTDTAALRQAIEDAAEEHDPIRVLVNNAANDQRHSTLDVDEAFWDSSLADNDPFEKWELNGSIDAATRANQAQNG